MLAWPVCLRPASGASSNESSCEMINEGLALPEEISVHSWRLSDFTLAWPVALRCPFIQKLPKSKSMCPFFCRDSSDFGSLGIKTPTTPIDPVAFTVSGPIPYFYQRFYQNSKLIYYNANPKLTPPQRWYLPVRNSLVRIDWV